MHLIILHCKINKMNYELIAICDHTRGLKIDEKSDITYLTIAGPSREIPQERHDE